MSNCQNEVKSQTSPTNLMLSSSVSEFLQGRGGGESGVGRVGDGAKQKCKITNMSHHRIYVHNI